MPPRTIAVIVKGTQNMLFADLVERIQALLRDAGRDASVYYLDEDADEVAYALKLCRERNDIADGENGGQLRAALQQAAGGGVGLRHGIAAGLALADRVKEFLKGVICFMTELRDHLVQITRERFDLTPGAAA